MFIDVTIFNEDYIHLGCTFQKNADMSQHNSKIGASRFNKLILNIYYVNTINIHLEFIYILVTLFQVLNPDLVRTNMACIFPMFHVCYSKVS